MTEEDEWVRAAMTDDTLVAELLLKIKHSQPQRSPPPAPPKPPLEWSVRQPRSKQVAPRKKALEPTRASPTTPLSWSGATSVSGGAADGFEESSLPIKHIEVSRSKVAVTSETPTTKRSRKKKTLAELKEEESLLLKERRNLNNKLVTLKLTMEKERAANECLKRMKLDLSARQMPGTSIVPVKSEEANSNHCQQVKLACDTTCSISLINAACKKLEHTLSNASSQIKETGVREPSFLLPDLNLPVEGDSGSDYL